MYSHEISDQWRSPRGRLSRLAARSTARVRMHRRVRTHAWRRGCRSAALSRLKSRLLPLLPSFRSRVDVRVIIRSEAL